MGVKGYITSDNIYYESENKLNDADTEVPIRPNSSLIWNGNNWDNEKRKLIRMLSLDDPDSFHLRGRADCSIPNNQSSGTVSVSQNAVSAVDDTKKGLNGIINIPWKDVLTIAYFVAGLFGVWLHTSERILTIEHKLSSVEKDILEFKTYDKDHNTFSEARFKALEAQVNELSILILRKNQ